MTRPEPTVSISARHRATPAHFLSEIVATLGLMLLIFASGCVGAYIGAAYSFTSSMSFRRPGDHHRPDVLRHLRGHGPSSAPNFIAAQILGGIAAIGLIRLLYPGITPAEAADITVPHHQPGSAGAALKRASPPICAVAGARRCGVLWMQSRMICAPDPYPVTAMALFAARTRRHRSALTVRLRFIAGQAAGELN